MTPSRYKATSSTRFRALYSPCLQYFDVCLDRVTTISAPPQSRNLQQPPRTMRPTSERTEHQYSFLSIHSPIQGPSSRQYSEKFKQRLKLALCRAQEPKPARGVSLQDFYWDTSCSWWCVGRQHDHARCWVHQWAQPQHHGWI